MQGKLLKIGWIIMLILGIYRAIASIALTATGETDVSSGILFFTNAVAIIGITLGSYRRAEAWSWWCLLVIGLLPVLGCSIIHGVNPWIIVGWILFIPAIVLPAQAVFGKEST